MWPQAKNVIIPPHPKHGVASTMYTHPPTSQLRSIDHGTTSKERYHPTPPHPKHGVASTMYTHPPTSQLRSIDHVTTSKEHSHPTPPHPKHGVASTMYAHPPTSQLRSIDHVTTSKERYHSTPPQAWRSIDHVYTSTNVTIAWHRPWHHKQRTLSSHPTPPYPNHGVASTVYTHPPTSKLRSIDHATTSKERYHATPPHPT